MSKLPVRRPTASHLLLLAILLLALALRLTRLDLAEFKADEAGIAREALALVRQRQFPAVGPSSSQGPAHPPLQIYLTALPFAVTQDPRLAVAVVALIHTAAVLMAYLLGARFFNPRTGLIAAFLFAVNPWAVYYARKMWTQNWPVATTLFFFCLLLLVVEERPWALAAAGLALIPLAGTHLGGLAFIVVLVLVLSLFPSYMRRRPFLIGAAIFVLFALPYLYHDATQDWQNLHGFFDLGAGQAHFDLQAARFAAWLSSGFHFQDLAGARHLQFLEGLPGLRWLDVVEMALLAGGLVYLIARVLRHALAGRARWRRSAGRDIVLLAWLLVPVALQTRHSQPVYPHYFILLYPAQHIIIASLLSDGLDWLRPRLGERWGRWSVAGLLGLIAVIGTWQVYLTGSFMGFVAHYDTPAGYGPVIGPSWRAAAAAGTAAVGGAQVLVVAQGDDPVWDNLPAVFDVLLPHHLPRRFVNGYQASVYPLGPAVYLLAPGMQDAATRLASQAATTSVERIDAPGGNAFWVFRRENDTRDDVLVGMTPLDPPRRLANGVELLAFQTDGEGVADGTLHFTLAWWLNGPAPDADYHTFAHLMGADGHLFGQHDLSSFATSSWRTGDLVLTFFEIQTDAATLPGDYRVRLGMYSYPDIVNVAVLDAAGNPTADSVTVGPIALH